MKATKKQLLIGGGAIVVLVFGTAVFLLVQQLNKSSDGDSNQQGGSGLPKVVDEAQNLRLNGKADEAAKKVDTALGQSNLPSETKYLLYMEKANAGMQAEQYQAALDAYKQAADIQKTSDVYTHIGEAQYLLGNKADAKAAYQQAISLLDKNSPTATSDKTDLEQRIAVIDGKDEE